MAEKNETKTYESIKPDLEAADESSRSRQGYVGVGAEYKNSSTIHKRALLAVQAEDEEGKDGEEGQKAETAAGLKAFANDTEDNEWNGTLAGTDDEEYNRQLEASKERVDAENKAAEDEDKDAQLQAAQTPVSAEKQSVDQAEASRPETAKLAGGRTPARGK